MRYSYINAHSLKPKADFMGIAGLKEELSKIEEAVKTNNLDAIEKLFNAALLLSTNSEKALKEMLEQL